MPDEMERPVWAEPRASRVRPDDREPVQTVDQPDSRTGPEQNGLRISWEIIGGHIILQAGCKRGIFHSYDEALFGLSKWAYELVKEGIEKELKRQLESKP